MLLLFVLHWRTSGLFHLRLTKQKYWIKYHLFISIRLLCFISLHKFIFTALFTPIQNRITALEITGGAACVHRSGTILTAVKRPALLSLVLDNGSADEHHQFSQSKHWIKYKHKQSLSVVYIKFTNDGCCCGYAHRFPNRGVRTGNFGK